MFETITRHRYVGRLTPRYGVTCGVEKEYLAWPITKRSLVRIQLPQQVRRETVALIFAHIFSFPSKEGFGEGVHGVREKQVRFWRPKVGSTPIFSTNHHHHKTFFDMKKIFALMALLCAVLVAGVSCNDKKPDIKYQLDVEGLVANQSTPISAEFKAFVCNTDSIKIVASRNVSPVDQALIEASLERQLLQTFGIKVQQGTAYDILVKGYVREANTGIAIYVDKRFTNSANPIYKAKPEPIGEFPADSLGN